MVATRKRKAANPKISQKTPKKATKTIQKPTQKTSVGNGIRKSGRRAKQFVPFDSSKDESRSKQKVKSKKAKAVVKSIRTRAKSVQRAKKQKSNESAPKLRAPVVAKDKNNKLQKRDFIEIQEENPFLFGSALKGARKVTSVNESTRLAIRFVLQKDVKALQKLVNDRKKFPSDGFDFGYAFENRLVPETLAALTEDQKVLDTVLQCQKKLAEETHNERTLRPVVGETLLDKMTSGASNFYMLGHATRAIEMTRGGREGNNALLNYDSRRKSRDVNWDALHLVQRNVSFVTLEHLISSKDSAFNSANFTNKIVHAVRMGHRKLAGKLAETYNSYSFNQLQLQTLLNDKQPLKKFLPISTTKKAIDNARITPFHTAAINPNVAYLKNLAEVDSNCNVPDSDNWYTIHYAAVCDGSGPLEYLLKKDIPILLTNKKKETPIHTAAAAGRVESLKVLLSVLRKKKSAEDKERSDENPDEDEEDGPPPPKKSKSKVVVKDSVTTHLNAKNRSGYSPLHLAVVHEHFETVKFLLDQPEVEVESQCGAAEGKLTPLMTACRRGNLEIANLLIEKGHSFVDRRDKLARTALTHAAMNGQIHVVAMLLRRGADIVTSTDSSGNSAVHYACAYGWLEILELLAKADDNALALTSINAWHLSALSVAYLKGHFNVVDYLLNGEFKEKISVNGKDNNGSTLIAAVVGSYREISDAAIKGQIEYLLERGADSSIVDAHLHTPLHILASTRAILQADSADLEEKVLSIDEYLKLTDALIDSGADVFAKDNDGEIALHKALRTGNIVLAYHLFNKDTVASAKEMLAEKASSSEDGQNNVLHLLAALPAKVYKEWTATNSCVGPNAVFYDVAPFFEKLVNANAKDRSPMVSQLNASNRDGFTPLLLLFKTMASFYGSVNLQGEDDVREEKKTVAEAVLKTMCELANRFTDFLPEAILNKCELKESPKAGGGQRASQAWNRRREKPSKAAAKIEESTCMANALRMVIPDEAPAVAEFCLNGKSSQLKNPLVELLLEKAAEHQLLKELLSAKDDEGLTPLLYSIAKNRDNEGRYILHVAEKHGLLRKILKDKYVQEVKESDNSTQRYECSALMLAAKHQLSDLLAGFSPSDEIAKEEDSYGNTVMHTFARKADGESLRHMKRFSEGGVTMKVNQNGRHPLHCAVDFETAADMDVSTDMIDYILSRYPQSARLQDCHGRTALHYAFVGKLPKETKTFEVSQAGAKRDPIAVVSVLLKFLDKKSINIADNFGNTALHYAAFHGANICVVTMLANGASEVTNLQGNTPLCLAVLKEHEFVALTLIQAKSDVCRHVFGDEVTQTEKEELENMWKWIPNRMVPNEKLQKSIASFVLQNGWLGCIYVLLDLLSKSPNTLLDLITAAVEHRKYNLLNMLLRLLERQNAKDSIARSDVIYHFFDNLQDFSTPLNGQTRCALQQLLGAGFTFDSNSLVTVASHGGVEILDELVAESEVNAMINADATAEKIFGGLIRSWSTVQHSRKEKLKEWIQRCASKVGIDCELEFPKPAFEGMEEFREERPASRNQKTTPLMWAIQNADSSLIRYLLNELKADVNKSDCIGRTPLMVAILWNSHKVVAALFNPQGSEKPEVTTVKTAKKITANAGFAAVLTNGGVSDSEDEDSAGSEDDEMGNFLGELAVVARNAKREAKSWKFTNETLDLQKVDSSNHTFRHYFVEPFGWENVSLLEQVCESAPSVKKGLEAPMQRALELGQWKMACAMAKIAKFPNPQWRPVQSSISLPAECSVDIEADSKSFLEGQQVSKTAEKKKLSPKPNENSGYAESGDLVKCGETGNLFRVLLTKSDVQHGMFGFHNFYRIELICRRGSSLYILFTNWGRIGDEIGQFQRTPFNTIEEATKEFASIFKQKTGNEWAKIAQFEDKPGKYRLVEIEDEGDVDLAEIEMKVDVSKKRVEKEPIYRILADIADVQRLKERTQAVKYDYNRAIRVPFGRINREKILQAGAILDELRLLTTDVEKARQETTKSIDRIIRLLNQQAELSNEFYKNMPLEGFTHGRLPVIDDVEIIKRFEKCLEELFEFDVAGTLITAAISSQARGKDPMDYIAEALECRIEILKPDCSDAQRILQCVQNSSEARVEGIFSITSKEPTEAFAESKLKNRKFLWHGTKPENMLSILKHGLKATPSSAVQTGQIYGEGIYFADLFAKSERYCSPSASGLKYALLCEVALGEVDTQSDDMCWSSNRGERKESKRIDTIQIYGSRRPNDAFNLTLENGVTIPLGKTIESNTVTINNEERRLYAGFTEYIVKDRRNTAVRYLVVFS